MGRMQASEMRNELGERVALEWHLRSNHYPPVNLVFVGVALEAIKRGRAGDWGAVLEMPNGLRRTVSQIVAGLHLDAWLEDEDA